jgi:multiple sugar transport system substrate-binding protein
MVEEPSDELSDEVVEIVYMRQASDIPRGEEIALEFNEVQSRIHVTVDNVPSSGMFEKLILTTEAGNPPDVFTTYWTLGCASKGYCMDLTPFIEAEGEEFFNSYILGSWDFNEYAGSYYGLPWRFSPNVVLLNRKVAEDAGVEIPMDIPASSSWTWDEFREFAQKLTDAENDVYGYCLTGSAEAFGTDAQFQTFLFSNGGKMINEQGLAGFNSPEGVETLQFLVDLINEYKVTPPGTTSAAQNICPDLVAAGGAAIWIDGSLWEGIIRKNNPGVDIVVLPMPYNNEMVTMDGGTGFGMSKFTEHPEEAWEFMKWLASDENQKDWAMTAKWQPGNVNVVNDPDFLAIDNNATVSWISSNYTILPLSHYPDNANLEAILRSYIQAAYLQTMTPKEALDAAAAEWDAVLMEYQADQWWDLWKR